MTTNFVLDNMLGVFDSGIGGLAVVNEIRKLVPNADIFYLADTKNLPYGAKTRKQVSLLVEQDIEYLNKQSVNGIVCACNTASTALLGNSDIVNMIEPTEKAFENIRGRVLILATRATIRSCAYQKRLAKNGVDYVALACEGFAQAIEEKDEGTKAVWMKRIIEVLKETGCDYVILGCTHYSLIVEAFLSAFAKAGLNIRIIDPAVYAAQVAVEKFNLSGTGQLKMFDTAQSIQEIPAGIKFKHDISYQKA